MSNRCPFVIISLLLCGKVSSISLFAPASLRGDFPYCSCKARVCCSKDLLSSPTGTDGMVRLIKDGFFCVSGLTELEATLLGALFLGLFGRRFSLSLLSSFFIISPYMNIIEGNKLKLVALPDLHRVILLVTS